MSEVDHAMHIPARRRFIRWTLGACAATGLGLPLARADDDATDEADDGIAYGRDPRQMLDVYAPDENAQAARPVVVYFYGGSWQAGQRADSRLVGEALAANGIVMVAPDYRIYPETVFPGFLDDAAAAVRWARDHAREYGGDPKRIVVMGHSAGAHIAAMLATDSRYLDAHGMSKRALAGMIGLAGPYATIPAEDHMSEIFPAALRARAMPISLVTGDEPPMMLATGLSDTVVDPRDSARFAAALRAHDDIVELKQYVGYGHGRIVATFSPSQRADSPVLADVLAFIDAHPPV
jgi:acetyl esterase/lipase